MMDQTGRCEHLKIGGFHGLECSVRHDYRDRGTTARFDHPKYGVIEVFVSDRDLIGGVNQDEFEANLMRLYEAEVNAKVFGLAR